MSTQLDGSQLHRLLNNLHTLTGLKFGLMDYGANEVYTSSAMNTFCERIQDTPMGYKRCRECDQEQLRGLTPNGPLMQYRCHAGLVEAAIPVTENGRIVAALLFGQLLSDGDIESQWAYTEQACAWYQDLPALKQSFYELRQMSQNSIQACTEIALACVSEVRFHGQLTLSHLTDFQRLALHIEQYYMDRLTLDSMSRALNMGKTKLCSLASREAGMTPIQMITKKRMAVARSWLASGNASVQSIAESVGIPDYNYFSKVFRRIVGLTPLSYRKQCREQSPTNFG